MWHHETTWLKGHVTLEVGAHDLSHYPFKFGACRSCSSADETFLICHETLSEHVTKEYIILWVRVPHPKSPLSQVWYIKILWKQK